MTDRDFDIRRLEQINELEQIVDLQAAIGSDSTAGIISLHSLNSYARNGGLILGAYDGDLLAGYLVGFIGTDTRDPRRPAMANLKLVLDALGVYPDYRGVGLATRLAMALRDHALTQGIRLVTLAFDPLSSRSAYLAVRKLGMIVAHYIPEYYGIPNEEQALAERSDRIIAEWWITRNRVEEKLFGQRHNLTLEHYLDADTPLLNPSSDTPDTSQNVAPYGGDIAVSDSTLLLVEIPYDYSAMVHNNRALARVWQKHIRALLGTAIRQGYVATDFLVEDYEGYRRAFYLLSYDGPTFRIETGE
jgi:predicted GNAT superfamily acetyltransferase